MKSAEVSKSDSAPGLPTWARSIVCALRSALLRSAWAGRTSSSSAAARRVLQGLAASSARAVSTAVAKRRSGQRSRSSTRRTACSSRTIRVAQGSGSQAPSRSPRRICEDRRAGDREDGDVASARRLAQAGVPEVGAERNVLRRRDLGDSEALAGEVVRPRESPVSHTTAPARVNVEEDMVFVIAGACLV